MLRYSHVSSQHMNQTNKRTCLLLITILVCVGTSSCAVRKAETSIAPTVDIQDSTTSYRSISIGNGIQVSIPAGWTVSSDVQKDQMSADMRQYFRNGVDAGVMAPLMFHAVSGPGWVVESVTINVKAAARVQPGDIRRIGAQDPQELSAAFEESLRELLQAVGSRLTKFDGATIQEFCGFPAAVSSYEYARGTNGKVGRLTVVYTGTSEITITQSAPIVRGGAAVARMDQIRDSIRIQ